MANQQGVIKKFMASLDTTTLSGAYAVDAAVKASGYSAGLDPLILQILNDCVAYNDADPTDGWKNFLADKCGINLDNRDTGAITGADAGGSVIKTADSIVPEDGSLINFTGNSFTANGLTIQLASLDEGYYQGDLNFDDLTATEKYIWQALYTWWAKNSLDLIADSYGNNFSFTDSSSATVKKMYFGFYNKDEGTPAVTYQSWMTDTGESYELSMMLNMNHYNTLAGGGNPNGDTGDEGLLLLDRLLSHEFTHAVMQANISYHYELPNFIAEGMAELTHGIDDLPPYRTDDLMKLASDPELLRQTLVYDVKQPEVEEILNPSYTGGYIFLRYLAKQMSTRGTSIDNTVTGAFTFGTVREDTLTTSAGNAMLSGFGGNDSIKNNGASNVTIDGGDDADQLYTYGTGTVVNTGMGDDYVLLYNDADNATVNAAWGNNEIYSGAQTALIEAGSGDDYIHLYTAATKHTIAAGGGDDTIMSYTTAGVLYRYDAGDGNDIITGFSDSDTLYIAGDDYSAEKISNDIIVTVGDGSVTLTGAASLSAANIVGDSSKVTLKNNSPSPYTISDTVEIVDASSRTKKIQIAGNGLNNSIVGGSANDIIYGRAGSDTLWGNSGNDSLFGGDGDDILSGDGADRFVYSAGLDVIFDYATEDVIKFAGTNYSDAQAVGDDVVFTVGNGSLTVNNAVGKNLTVMDSSGSTRSVTVS